MNFEKQGLNIAKIKHVDNLKTFKEIPIFITEDKKVLKNIHTLDNITIPEETQDTEIIQQLPYIDKKAENNRQILYVSGCSGSGKSYYTMNYIHEYTKKFPNNKIILYSSVTKDEKLDKFKNLRRIQLDEAFLNKQFTIDDFQDSLVVYDDTETIADKSIFQKLENIKNLILTCGRHTNTFCIITSHNTNAGPKTKLILIEAHSITLFLKTMGFRSLKYILESNFGFDRDQIKKIKKLDSRWVTILKTYPISIMYESGIFMI